MCDYTPVFGNNKIVMMLWPQIIRESKTDNSNSVLSSDEKINCYCFAEIMRYVHRCFPRSLCDLKDGV